MASKKKKLTDEEKKKLIEACIPHVRACVKAQIEQWDAERAIEREVGDDVEGLYDCYSDLAVTTDLDTLDQIGYDEVKMTLEAAGVI